MTDRIYYDMFLPIVCDGEETHVCKATPDTIDHHIRRNRAVGYVLEYSILWGDVIETRAWVVGHG